MGFFSGSFGSGLVKGLATSIDATLKSAMDQRNKDMSRARTFWETRQAQKLERAEEHDARAEKAIVRLANEFDGDFARGLAAYKALGGDIDKVESYINDVDETRKINSSYSLKDKITFDKIDLSQYGDVDKERAMKAIRMEVKPVSFSYKDTSGLAKIGLGMDDAGEKMSEEINTLYQARLAKDIDGLQGAVVDREGLIGSEALKNKLVSTLPALKKSIISTSNQLDSGIGTGGKQLTEEDKNKLNKKLVRDLSLFEQFETAGKTGTSSTLTRASKLTSLYQSGYRNLEKLWNYKVEGNNVLLTKDNQKWAAANGAGVKKWTEVKREFHEKIIRKYILNNDGSYKGEAERRFADFMPEIRSLVPEIQKQLKPDADKTETVKSPSNKTETVKSPDKSDTDKTPDKTEKGPSITKKIYSDEDEARLAKSDPRSYAAALAKKRGKNLTDAQIENRLKAIGLKPDVIQQVISGYNIQRGMTSGMFR